MKTPDTWRLMERLADPELPRAERERLEAKVAADPELRARFAVFKNLMTWPQIEPAPQSAAMQRRLLERLRHERERAATDREVGRLFPVFAGLAAAAALAIGIVNFQQFGEMASTTLDAVFGLPEHSVENELLTQL